MATDQRQDSIQNRQRVRVLSHISENRRKPCRGRLYGLQAELKLGSKKEIPAEQFRDSHPGRSQVTSFWSSPIGRRQTTRRGYMASPKRSRIKRENTAVLLIDHQVGLFTGVRDLTVSDLKHNVVSLAKAAKTLGLPVVATTTARDRMWGPTIRRCPLRCWN